MVGGLAVGNRMAALLTTRGSNTHEKGTGKGRGRVQDAPRIDTRPIGARLLHHGDSPRTPSLIRRPSLVMPPSRMGPRPPTQSSSPVSRRLIADGLSAGSHGGKPGHVPLIPTSAGRTIPISSLERPGSSWRSIAFIRHTRHGSVPRGIGPAQRNRGGSGARESNVRGRAATIVRDGPDADLPDGPPKPDMGYVPPHPCFSLFFLSLFSPCIAQGDERPAPRLRPRFKIGCALR